MGSLPRNSEELYSTMKPLDYDWLSESCSLLLERMQTCSQGLKAHAADVEQFAHVFDEFCLSDNSPELVHAVFKWLGASCLNTAGRREARHFILEYFKSPKLSLKRSEDFLSFEAPTKSETDSDVIVSELKFASKRA